MTQRLARARETAGAFRPAKVRRTGGAGRESTPAAEAVSRYLRDGSGEVLERRRRTGALNVGAVAALGLVALYQLGVLRHLPDPPFSVFDSDEVDAAGEAYAVLTTPDAPIGMMSYAVTAVLAGMGGAERARERPWIPLALAAKVVVDALGGLYLTLEQVTRHRKLCFYCLLAAVASIASVREVIPRSPARLRGTGAAEVSAGVGNTSKGGER